MVLGMVVHTLISAPRRLRQEDIKFKTSLGERERERSCLKTKTKMMYDESKRWSLIFFYL
jgi:hypothetical protein